jgi:hypothetical protein
VTLQGWITTAVGIAGLLFGIYAYSKNRKPRRLTYVVETDELLVPTTEHQDWGQLTVKIGDFELNQPRTATIRITNTGKVEARLEDYDEYLRVVLLDPSSSSAILAAAATLNTPAEGTKASQGTNLADISGSGDAITLPKVLLNERDSIRIRLLINGSDGELAVRGRLAGFKINSLQVESRYRPPKLAVMAGLIGGLAAVLVATVIYSVSHRDLQAVPDVRGLDSTSAVNRLDEYQFRTQVLRDFPSSKPVGTVIEQSPEGGYKLPPNSEVTILLSSGHQ